MSERERHTPAAGTPLPADPPAPSPSTEPSLWESWYARATPVQQQEMLALAARQGLVYRHQLPPVNGTAAAGPRPLLPLLLSGPAQRLQIPPLLALEPVDTALDARQREAVSRVLASPDVCLIQGYPGTGKSRVAVEIIVQAVRRGLRVLLLAPTAAAIDHILERLTGQPDLCPLRCLGPAESAPSLSPCVRRLTVAERARVFEQETLETARQTLCRSQQSQHALGCLLDQQAALAALARQHEEATARRQLLLEQRAVLPQAVQADTAAASAEGTSDFHRAWQACTHTYRETKERLEGQRAVWQAERETIRGKQEQLALELEQVRPLSDARQEKRWWTGTWWRAMLGSNPQTRLHDLEGRQAELQAALARLDEELAGCAQRQQQAEADHQAQTQHLLAAEVGRRQAQLDEQLSQLDEQRQAAEQQWQALAVPGGPPLPERMTLAAVEEARAHWDQLRQEADQQTQVAGQWLAAVEETAARLPEHLGTWANLVAATTAAALAGALPPTTLADGFDLLVLDEAHQVTESELTGVARHARRWALLGEPPLEEEGRPEAPSRPLRPAALRPGFFQRLWQHLHAEPRRLPCSWQERQGLLVCRLLAVAHDQEPFLESEPLADRPEVELRILAAPRQPPRLAEVVFPRGASIAEAKALLYQDLQELTAQAAGPCLHWSETPGHILVDMGQAPPQTISVHLEEGLVEVVGCKRAADETTAQGACWYTWRLEFEKHAGWTRERAEGWLRERLGLHDLRRTVLLTTPYRGHAGLVRFLSDLLFSGACEPATQHSDPSGDNDQPAVELIPVPPLVHDNRRHGEGPAHANPARPRLRAARGGAGLEQDLSETRPLEHLPADLRALLPRQGLVNYLEALAVVKKLEELAGDPELRAAACRWQQQALLHPLPTSDNGCDRQPAGACAAAMPVVAVMAPYPAQVELIRLLVQRSPLLASDALPLEVGLPADFQQRECLLALVSLTRSHAHRAVCYGDSPEVLVQALTRPAGRLLLFGDPATLVRRSQWQGPLDHLDERSAQRERRLLDRLVRYLQGRGSHPRAFRVQEGCGV